MRIPSLILVLALAAAPLVGCRTTAYYDVMEAFGKEKRDLLASELRGMVDDQEEAEEAFEDALTRVKALTGFDGGPLEREYDRLKAAHADAEASADDIDSRTEDIDGIANDMFEEWKGEIAQMTTPTLRGTSQRKLDASRAKYAVMREALLESRAKMDPALALLKDHVLFLKHNLNAAALGDLGRAMREIEYSIEELQDHIQVSIREAQGFMETIQ